MAAMLKQNKIDYHILDMNLGYSSEQILEFVEGHRPHLICITVFSAGYKKVYSLIEFIRSYHQGLIVIGGPHISITTEQSLKATPADFAVVGEGEHTLSELIDELNNSNPEFQKINGLIWRRGGYKIIMNEKRDYINNLDALPFPAFEDFELEKYLCYVDKRLPIITSRGCPYRCNYCCTPLCMGKKFRVRSPENVVDEIEHWHKRGWSIFDFNDDVFTLDKKRARNICDLITERGLDIKFNLYVGIRADIDEDLLQSLKTSGCRFISYGCESGSDRILKTIKKGLRARDVMNSVNITRKVGVNCKVNFIIGHSTETYEDAMQSIKLAKNLKSNFVGFNNMVPYPGTQAYQWIQDNETARFLYSPEVYLNELTHKRLIITFETDEFTAKEREKLLKIGLDLEKKTLACFRFGKYKGYFVYLLTRNEWISLISTRVFKLFVSTNIGSAIYKLIVKPPW